MIIGKISPVRHSSKFRPEIRKLRFSREFFRGPKKCAKFGFFCRSGNSLNFFIKKSLVLDEAGWYFEVEWEDVNHDGKKDILATTWSRTGENGQSMAYELNGLNWQDKNAWIRY